MEAVARVLTLNDRIKKIIIYFIWIDRRNPNALDTLNLIELSNKVCKPYSRLPFMRSFINFLIATYNKGLLIRSQRRY